MKAERTIKRFDANYGAGAAVELVDMLKAGERDKEVAYHFGVTQESARQWRAKFGQTIKQWRPHPDVMQVLGD